jgi:hypothetical protein
MKYKIELEVESERNADMIKAYIIYSLKMLKIKKIEIKEQNGD